MRNVALDMNQNHKQILSEEAVSHKIRRMAFEVLENNLEEPELLVVGVFDKGYHIAESLMVELSQICEIPVKLIRLDVDKNNPRFADIAIDAPGELIGAKTVL